MKLFLKYSLSFLLLGTVIILVGIFLPTSTAVRNSLLFAQFDKEELLKSTTGKRIVFIGGSNLSFGLNSQMIKDSLDLNPINTAIHANIGLQFMLNKTFDLIRTGDIVVICPEYDQYYGSFAYGAEELLRMVLDVSSDNLKNIGIKQAINISPYIFKYAFSKYNPFEYTKSNKKNKIDVYTRSAFNKYGDVDIHWNLPQEKFTPFGEVSGNLNEHIIAELKIFATKLKEKGCTVYLTFPAYQDISFDKSSTKIATVYQTLNKSGIQLLGNPKLYRFPDKFMYNTPYHLTKAGVAIRTELLINDLKDHNNKRIEECL